MDAEDDVPFIDSSVETIINDDTGEGSESDLVGEENENTSDQENVEIDDDGQIHKNEESGDTV